MQTTSNKSFVETIRAMSAFAIIMAMVNGLRNPSTEVLMTTFGRVVGGVCYGCAATNTIAQISGVKFSVENISILERRADTVGSDRRFLDAFESAVDSLRRGDLKDYNFLAQMWQFPKISNPKEIILPKLDTDNYKENLAPYEELALANRTFEETVRAMQPSEIVMSMVNGLKAEHVNINMMTYGTVGDFDGLCYGCAATNAVCEISGTIFNENNIYHRNRRASALGTDDNFLARFEQAIDSLRGGNVDDYNEAAKVGGFALIYLPNDFNLTHLNSSNYLEHLAEYEALASLQPKLDSFEYKVRNMSGREIVMAMVEGLREPAVKVDMNTYGDIDPFNEICVGCAATNTVCRISGIVFDEQNIGSTGTRSDAVQTEEQFVDSFEYAINALRLGNIDAYNKHASKSGIPQLVVPDDGIILPALTTSNYKENLDAYVTLAEAQPA